jgi:hypothetical protein
MDHIHSCEILSTSYDQEILYLLWKPRDCLLFLDFFSYCPFLSVHFVCSFLQETMPVDHVLSPVNSQHRKITFL